MARTSAIAVQNNFVKGLITEATGLTFPENACTDTENCVFTRIGDVTRRLGFDLEQGFSTQTQSTVGSAMVSYLWKAPAGLGNTNVVVVQIGNILYFYTVNSLALSSSLSNATINLLNFAVAGVSSVSTLECQFAAGNGYLFVTNENCDPFYVTYTPGANPAFTATKLTIQIRDFKGIQPDSTVNDSQRPTSLTSTHRYNLANQGWPSSYSDTSTSSVAIGTGTKTFTTTSSTLPINPGDRVRIYNTPMTMTAGTGYNTNTGNMMIGSVTSYSGTTLVVSVDTIHGSGTLASWTIVSEPDYLSAW